MAADDLTKAQRAALQRLIGANDQLGKRAGAPLWVTWYESFRASGCVIEGRIHVNLQKPDLEALHETGYLRGQESAWNGDGGQISLTARAKSYQNYLAMGIIGRWVSDAVDKIQSVIDWAQKVHGRLTT